MQDAKFWLSSEAHAKPEYWHRICDSLKKNVCCSTLEQTFLAAKCLILRPVSQFFFPFPTWLFVTTIVASIFRKVKVSKPCWLTIFQRLIEKDPQISPLVTRFSSNIILMRLEQGTPYILTPSVSVRNLIPPNNQRIDKRACLVTFVSEIALQDCCSLALATNRIFM